MATVVGSLRRGNVLLASGSPESSSMSRCSTARAGGWSMADDSEVMDQLRLVSRQLVDLQQQVADLADVVGELRAGRQPHDSLLGARDIWEYVGRGRSWFYEARKKGLIPTPDGALGDRGGERWRRSTIDQAMAIQAKGRPSNV